MKGEILDVLFKEGTGEPDFAVVVSKKFSMLITFSIIPSVWREKKIPWPHEIVYFNRVKKEDGGLRAYEVRYWTREDEMKENEASMRRAS